MRGPLIQINEFSRLLIEKLGPQAACDPDAQTYLNFIQSNSHKLENMLAGIKAYSQVIKHVLDIQNFITEEFMHELVNTLANSHTDLANTLEIGFMPEEISADRSQLLQVFVHLIENSLKFHKPDKSPQVEVLGVDSGTHWSFSIIDNGLGIEPNLHKGVFKLFRMLDPHGENAGTGVGLTIAKEIIEAHGGEIWIEPESLEGTTVSFTLPKKIRDDR